MKREEVQAQIETLEALGGVLSAIDEVSGVEFAKGEAAVINLSFEDREKAPITFAHGIPQDVALAGLEAMKTALEARLASASPSDPLERANAVREGMR